MLLLQMVLLWCLITVSLHGLLAPTSGLTTEEMTSVTSHGHVTFQTESDGNYIMFATGNVTNVHEVGNVNPNEVEIQDYQYYIPKTPTMLDSPGCLQMGVIAMTVAGVPVFNPYTAQGYNAVEGSNAETFDNCDGHPDNQGRYHYHMLAGCLPQSTTDEVVGVSLDGFAIYGNKDENGNTLTHNDLDECNGRYINGQYRYHVTADFPYYLGCYKGYVDTRNSMGGQAPAGEGGAPPPGGERPPPGGDATPAPSGGTETPPPGGDDRQPPAGGDQTPSEGDDQRPAAPPSGEGGDDGRTGRDPGAEGGRTKRQTATGNCYYANVFAPQGFDDLQAGVLNNGLTSPPESEDGPAGAAITSFQPSKYIIMMLITLLFTLLF